MSSVVSRILPGILASPFSGRPDNVTLVVSSAKPDISSNDNYAWDDSS